MRVNESFIIYLRYYNLCSIIFCIPFRLTGISDFLSSLILITHKEITTVVFKLNIMLLKCMVMAFISFIDMLKMLNVV